MRVLLAGGSGFVGRALAASLRSANHEVRLLVRRPAGGPQESTWNPAEGHILQQDVAWAEGVVNLCGEPIADGRWTDERRRLLWDSRIAPTRTLVRALAASPGAAGKVLVNASAIGFYGDRGEAQLDEQSVRGAGFLAGLCEAWENEAVRAEAAGSRVVRLRIGLVLGPGGGALGHLTPLFRRGLGGRLGGGGAWTSWIALEDLVALVETALEDTRYRGPLNGVAPNPVRNALFTRALAVAVHRPAWCPVPAWTLKLFLGDLAGEVLLSSARVVPRGALELGFSFRHANIETALEAALVSAPQTEYAPAGRGMAAASPVQQVAADADSPGAGG